MYQVSTHDLTREAQRISDAASEGKVTDATDRVAIAVLKVGAAICERLENVVAGLKQVRQTR